jgi:uncharacterized OB-fold protein
MPFPSYPPPPDFELAGPFWAGVAEGELRLPRCSACGRFEWYPKEAGPSCAGARYEWTRVPGTGTLFSWTRVERRFLPERGDPPYVVGLVELDGADGVRLVANLADDVQPQIGDRVEVRFETVDGQLRPVFAPLAAAVTRTEDRRVT